MTIWAKLGRFLAVGLLATAFAAAEAGAQDIGVAAVVNDDAITAFDLEMRVRLALLSANLPDSLESRRRIVPQTLRKLIDERLQMQEAKRLKISVSKEELARAIANIEQQNRMPPGGLARMLAEANISISTIERQAEADIAWVKVVRFTMMPRVKVGDDEIDERLDLLKASIGQPEYLLAEIVLAVEEADQEAEIQRLGERIIAQLREGVPFQALARQFSHSASSANGGDLGWVAGNALDPEIAEAVAAMQPGKVSPMLRTVEGFQILMLRERRIAGKADAREVSVALAQAVVPVATSREAAERIATEIAGNVKSCADVERTAKERQLPQSGRLGTVRLSDLPDGLRAVVGDLPVLRASAPIAEANAFRVLMVCGRSGGSDDGLPGRQEVQNRIEEERLDLMARRYLRELRRAAFVEVRL